MTAPTRPVQPGRALRSVLLVAHTGRPTALEAAQMVTSRFRAAGVRVCALAEEAGELDVPGDDRVTGAPDAADDCELVVVLGGDGTILRGAELARHADVPLLGVNLGHVGFLAEAERDDLAAVVDAAVAGAFEVEERMTIDVSVTSDGTTRRGWALNEATVEKASRERVFELVIEVDGRPLQRWGCDGVVLATPTGSTAYAFSAGGPVVWPEVEALLLVPIAAHALFARPLVTRPEAVLAVEVLPSTQAGVVWCDGRRPLDVPPGSRVEVRRGERPVRLARLEEARFTDRLVAKFGLPVHGWRGRSDERHDDRHHDRSEG